MKVSKEEIDAAIAAFAKAPPSTKRGTAEYALHTALVAAAYVRADRKESKRQKKREKDLQNVLAHSMDGKLGDIS